MADNSTIEQRIGMIAASALERLARLRDDHACLARQLDQLADWAAEHEHDLDYEELAHAADAVAEITGLLSEMVRDLVCRLPIMVLDWDL
ncbi:hypothetical protein ACORG1_22980 [Mycobacterium sp. TJFP1]